MRTYKGWLNRNILGMGSASLFSDMNHEMATAVLPLFLSSVLGAPAFALGVIEGVADGISTVFEVWSGWYSDRLGNLDEFFAKHGLCPVRCDCGRCRRFAFSFALSEQVLSPVRKQEPQAQHAKEKKSRAYRGPLDGD